MNILYVLQYYPVYGGGETVTVKLSNEFVKRGHSVFIAYTIDNYSVPMPYEIDERIKKQKFKNLANKPSNDDINELHKYIVNNKIDIVINQWADKKLCYKATRGTQAKLIKCYHISTFYPYIPTTYLKKYLKKFFPHLWFRYYHYKQLKAHKLNYKYSDKYIFLTKEAAEELYKEFKYNKEKVSYIPNPATYSEYASPSITQTKKNKIIFIGRMFENTKRMSYILDAWKLLGYKNKQMDWKLLMIGEGPDKQLVKNKIKEEKIQNVEVLDFCNPLNYYKESSILLMSSYIEGFGMVIVEGMQYGVVPIVTDSFSAIKTIIDNNINGIIVANNNIMLYAETIYNLMNDKTLRNRLAINAIQKSKVFDINNVVEQWEDLFNNLKK